MNITSIKDVYLVTCVDEADPTSYHMKKFMSNNSITFTHLHFDFDQKQYNVDNFSLQVQNDNLKLLDGETAESAITTTPFVIYRVVCDDGREISRTIRSLEQLVNSNIKDLQP